MKLILPEKLFYLITNQESLILEQFERKVSFWDTVLLLHGWKFAKIRKWGGEFWGKELSPGAEIFRIEHSQKFEVVCQKCCQTGNTDFWGSFSGVRSDDFRELKRARVERKVGFKQGLNGDFWGWRECSKVSPSAAWGFLRSQAPVALPERNIILTN